jgi:hypothetical protein
MQDQMLSRKQSKLLSDDDEFIMIKNNVLD